MTPIDFGVTRSKVKIRGHMCRTTILVLFACRMQLIFSLQWHVFFLLKVKECNVLNICLWFKKKQQTADDSISFWKKKEHINSCEYVHLILYWASYNVYLHFKDLTVILSQCMIEQCKVAINLKITDSRSCM